MQHWQIEHSDKASRISPGMQYCFHTHRSINMMCHINNMKAPKHAIISIDAEQVSDKTQLSFILEKKSNKLDIERYIDTERTIFYTTYTPWLLENSEVLLCFQCVLNKK